MVQLLDRPFDLPTAEAPQAEWEAAAAQLNAVHFTGRQLYRAMQAYIAIPSDGLDTAAKDSALTDYLYGEALRPVTVAAMAAHVRHGWLTQYVSDLALSLDREEWPAYYEAAARARLVARQGRLEPLLFEELVELARDVAW